MAVGLFLGAGASYEIGMPLVWGLTNEIKEWLTPAKLRELNEAWKLQGGGHSEEIITHVSDMLSDKEMHYESILGNIEIQQWRNRANPTGWNGIYSWLVDLVYQLLYVRHIQNPDFIRVGLRYLEGIIGLGETSNPLWIFSLNHDLVIEALAADYGKTISSGLPQVCRLPLRESSGQKIGELACEALSGETFDRTGLDFFTKTADINLIKIHGSLDTFMTSEGRDFIKIGSAAKNSSDVIDSLRKANEQLLFVNGRSAFQAVRTLNEITYEDDEGEMQFLRKTILSGARKFDPRSQQTLPLPFIKQFANNLNYVRELFIIGYGLGDHHINTIIREWLEFAGDRKAIIIGPGMKVCPPFLLHIGKRNCSALRGSRGWARVFRPA